MVSTGKQEYQRSNWLKLEQQLKIKRIEELRTNFKEGIRRMRHKKIKGENWKGKKVELVFEHE